MYFTDHVGYRRYDKGNLPDGILSTFGIKDGVGTLSDADFQRLRNVKGRTLFQYYSSLPLFVAFGDESNPRSIREVATGNMAMAFPGVRFGGA